MRPTRYFVEYVTRWREDEAPDTELFNTDSLKTARYIYNLRSHALPQIFERTNIRDVTPKGDPRGLIWDFEEKLIEDCPHA